MSKALISDEALESRERIMSYLTGKDIVLSDKESEQLERWQFCDDLIRTRRYGRSEIIRMIVEKFAISQSVASRDVGDTHFVFGSTTKYNKNYLIVLHIDECDKFIRRYGSDEEMSSAVVRMYETRRRYVELLEKESAGEELPPVAIQFVLNKIDANMDVADAMAAARKMIKKDVEDISFEDEA